MVNVWEHLNFAEEASHFCRIHSVADDAAVLYDETGEYAEAVGLRGVPFNFVVNEDGIVVAAGATTPLEVMETLSALLGGDESASDEEAAEGTTDAASGDDTAGAEPARGGYDGGAPDVEAAAR